MQQALTSSLELIIKCLFCNELIIGTLIKNVNKKEKKVYTTYIYVNLF